MVQSPTVKTSRIGVGLVVTGLVCTTEAFPGNEALKHVRMKYSIIGRSVLLQILYDYRVHIMEQLSDPSR